MQLPHAAPTKPWPQRCPANHKKQAWAHLQAARRCEHERCAAPRWPDLHATLAQRAQRASPVCRRRLPRMLLHLLPLLLLPPGNAAVLLSRTAIAAAAAAAGRAVTPGHADLHTQPWLAARPAKLHQDWQPQQGCRHALPRLRALGAPGCGVHCQRGQLLQELIPLWRHLVGGLIVALHNAAHAALRSRLWQRGRGNPARRSALPTVKQRSHDKQRMASLTTHNTPGQLWTSSARLPGPTTNSELSGMWPAASRPRARSCAGGRRGSKCACDTAVMGATCRDAALLHRGACLRVHRTPAPSRLAHLLHQGGLLGVTQVVPVGHYELRGAAKLAPLLAARVVGDLQGGAPRRCGAASGAGAPAALTSVGLAATFAQQPPQCSGGGSQTAAAGLDAGGTRGAARAPAGRLLLQAQLPNHLPAPLARPCAPGGRSMRAGTALAWCWSPPGPLGVLFEWWPAATAPPGGETPGRMQLAKTPPGRAGPSLASFCRTPRTGFSSSTACYCKVAGDQVRACSASESLPSWASEQVQPPPAAGMRGGELPNRRGAWRIQALNQGSQRNAPQIPPARPVNLSTFRFLPSHTVRCPPDPAQSPPAPPCGPRHRHRQQPRSARGSDVRQRCAASCRS